nr:MAG TPA: hypothetical protein [Caudoviricetes sp.]
MCAAGKTSLIIIFSCALTGYLLVVSVFFPPAHILNLTYSLQRTSLLALLPPAHTLLLAYPLSHILYLYHPSSTHVWLWKLTKSCRFITAHH